MATNNSNDTPKRVLLPTTVRPVHYHVSLAPDLKTFKFTGKVVVDLEVKQDGITQLDLHAQDMELHTATIGGRSMKAATMNKDDETVAIELDGALAAGNAQLTITFTGNLNDQMAGFYRARYLAGGEERYMAVTQFEPTDARRAFPCWDEPALKATFTIELDVPEGLTALSNMPAVDTRKSETAGNKVVTFDKTPIVSTYLVAFVVGDLDYVEGKTAEGVTVRVYAPAGKSSQGHFALQMATRTLSYFGEYFGIAYPLPKQDMVAIPDFAAGAMENWGLITYRETALLIDEESSPVSQKQRVAYVVGHELAHQWFGNLVTMEWWKELWLNEGFATYVGQLAVAHFYPEWDMWTQFVSSYSTRALGLDGLASSHPIEVEVRTSAEVNEIFDAISYCKGASVIRMLVNYIGEPAFRKGLNIYLNRHKYANAVTEDLWKALSESSGKDISAFMGNWTKKMGYPVVSVERAEGKADEFRVAQRRFLASGAEPDEKTVWNVPLNFVSSKAPKATPEVAVLAAESDTVRAACADGADWVLANAGYTNFYRTKYSQELLTQLGAGLEAGALGATDRLGLQSDLFALAAAGLAGTDASLALAARYTAEVDYTVWTSLAENLGDVASAFAGTPAAEGVRALSARLAGSALDKVGMDARAGDSDMDQMLRGLLLGVAGLAGHEAAVAKCRDLFAQFNEDPKRVNADLRKAVFRTVMRHGDAAVFDKLVAAYRSSDMHEEKIRLLAGLASSSDPALIERALEFALSDDVRPQDVWYPIAFATGTAAGREKVWAFLQTRWEEFDKRFGSGQFLLARIVQYAISGFNSHAKVAEVEAFFAAHPCPPAARTIQQGLESIRTQANWLERDLDRVTKHFQSS